MNFIYGWKHAEAHCHHGYILPVVEELLPKKKGLRILDLGCGTGFGTARLAELGNEVVGVDPAEDGIALARNRWPKVRFEIGSGYDDLSGLMPTAGWDVVVASEVIEHLFYPKSFIENACRHLRIGGSLILTTPYHGYLKNLALSVAGAWDRHLTANWEGGHIKFFSVQTLSDLLLGSGLANIEYRFAGRLPYLWKSMVCRGFYGASKDAYRDELGQNNL